MTGMPTRPAWGELGVHLGNGPKIEWDSNRRLRVLGALWITALEVFPIESLSSEHQRRARGFKDTKSSVTANFKWGLKEIQNLR